MRTLAAMLALVDPTAVASRWRDSDLIPYLLIGLFLLAIILGLVCLYVVIRLLRVNRMMMRSHQAEVWPQSRWFHVAAIQGPLRWMAIKTSNLHLVQSALGLWNPRPCSWSEGLNRSREHKLFLSPPMSGWIVILGAELPDPDEDIDQCFKFVSKLSQKLGHVQFFHQNRVLHHHAWVRAENGKILRAYAWAGKTIWNQGTTSDEEVKLRVKCYDYGETPQTEGSFTNDAPSANTEKVALLAARWSIDRMTVDPTRLREARGIAGRLSPKALR